MTDITVSNIMQPVWNTKASFPVQLLVATNHRTARILLRRALGRGGTPVGYLVEVWDTRDSSVHRRMLSRLESVLTTTNRHGTVHR